VSGPLILGLETSCDETSAAVLKAPDTLKGHVIYSQDEHILYGGVVPEIAARAHVQRIDEVVDRALEEAGCALGDLDAVAVTAGPGLIGALLVGVCWAKAAAFGLGRPLVAVHHMEAHLFAPSLEQPNAEPPFVALLVSGGHTLLLHASEWGTYRLLGQTRDDAAGEAFDKAARVLGLGFPGGPAIQKASESSVGGEARFPRPNIKDSLDFSFSGLKSAVVRRAQEKNMYPPPEDADLDAQEVANVAAAFQEAMVDSMVIRTLAAAKLHNVKGILLGGGVASNSLLRSEMKRRAPIEVVVPVPPLCTDNGAMIGAAAFFHLRHGNRFQWDMDVIPNLRLG